MNIEEKKLREKVEQLQAELSKTASKLEQLAKAKKVSLEEEFRNACALAYPEINAALNRADQAMKDAKAIAEQYGVPFVVPFGYEKEQFVPRSFEKFRPLGESEDENSDDINDCYSNKLNSILNEFSSYIDFWVSSSIC